jgi:hypothetical protein
MTGQRRRGTGTKRRIKQSGRATLEPPADSERGFLTRLRRCKAQQIFQAWNRPSMARVRPGAGRKVGRRSHPTLSVAGCGIAVAGRRATIAISALSHHVVRNTIAVDVDTVLPGRQSTRKALRTTSLVPQGVWAPPSCEIWWRLQLGRRIIEGKMLPHSRACTATAPVKAAGGRCGKPWTAGLWSSPMGVGLPALAGRTLLPTRQNPL